MCFKKKPPVPIIEPGKRKTALLFGINDYLYANDLNGCLNDLIDVEKTLNEKFPGFTFRKFTDSEVTKSRFKMEVDVAISNLIAGDVLLVYYSGHGTQVHDSGGDEADSYDEAIYLNDGPVIDDDIGHSLMAIPDGATVILMFDSCFSGSVTRLVQQASFFRKRIVTNRFHPLPHETRRSKKKVRFSKEEMKWIVFSGCGESQTSADAYIGGSYRGAFSYYAMKTLRPDMTYAQWIIEINRYLPSSSFDQFPTLEGKELTKKVFT